MSISYKKLFHLMIDQGVSNGDLMEKAQISANIIPRMKKNGYISLETVEKICLEKHTWRLAWQPRCCCFSPIHYRS